MKVLTVDVHFLGKPVIYHNKLEVNIRQRKLLAVLLYLIYNRQCSRDELISIFWDNLDEESARQNLRNAIYRLRKILGTEFFNVKESVISISKHIKLICDTDDLVSEDGGLQILDLDNVVFLDQLYLKETPEFDRWVMSKRSAYEKIISIRLEYNMRELMRTGNPSVEAYAQKLLSILPYNEEAARTLMQYYCKRGLYHDALSVYNKLVNILNDELGVQPEALTQKIYEKTLELRSVHTHVFSQTPTVQHSRAIDSLMTEYNRFLSSDEYSHYIICGGIGSGKSSIIQNFIKEAKNDALIYLKFEIAHSDIPFYSIGKILVSLAEKCAFILTEPTYHDFDTLKLYHIIAMDKLINKMQNQHSKIVLVVENMEAIDRRSMDIIFSHLLEKSRNKIMMVGEYCISFSQDYQLLSKLDLIENVKIHRLPPLTRQETTDYLVNRLSNAQMRQIDVVEVMAKTGGILMFLNDVIDHIYRKDKDIFIPTSNSMQKLMELFSSLSATEQDTLKLLSIFNYGVEIRTLAEILNKNIMPISAIIEHLYQRKLIVEENFENYVLAKINCDMLRQALYSQISKLSRTELHRLIAEYYNSHLEGQKEYFFIRELKYHFGMAGKEYESIYFALEELWLRLDYCDEFFPSLQSNSEVLDAFYLSRADTYFEFERFETLLERFARRFSKKQVSYLTMIYEYLKGRTLIRDSRNKEGVLYIERVIRNAQIFERDDILIRAYLEMVFHGLRSENEQLMRSFITKIREIPSFAQYDKENGILLRLEAMCDIMRQEYEHAEDLLRQSITVLENPRLRSESVINIAAAYDYLGVIYRITGEYEQSIISLEKAILLCNQHHVRKSLDIFYEDLGYTLFLQGRYEEAKDNFLKSINVYNQFDNTWLRSICDSCMSMICIREVDYDKALEYYRRAEIYAAKNHTSSEMKILSQAKAELEQIGILKR